MPGKLRKAPPRTSYSNKDHGSSGSYLPTGNYLFREGSKVDLHFPNDKRPLWIRPLPQVCNEDVTTFDPARKSLEEGELSDWFREIPVASYAGCQGRQVSFITYNPVWKNLGYEPMRENPYWVAYYALKKAKNSTDKTVLAQWNSEWNPTIANNSNFRDELWKSPSTQCVVQGFLYEAGGEVKLKDGNPAGAGPSDNMPVVVMSGGAGRAMKAMFEIRNPECQGPADDYEGHFKYGDPVHPDFGRFLAIYKPDCVGWDDLKATSVAEGVSSSVNPQFAGYEIRVAKAYAMKGNKKLGPKLTADQRSRALERVQWWDEILNVPAHTPDADFFANVEAHHHLIATWMAKAFLPLKEMLIFGWRDHPEFRQYSEVASILGEAVSVSVGDGAPFSSGGGVGYDPNDVEDDDLADDVSNSDVDDDDVVDDVEDDLGDPDDVADEDLDDADLAAAGDPDIDDDDATAGPSDDEDDEPTDGLVDPDDDDADVAVEDDEDTLDNKEKIRRNLQAEQQRAMELAKANAKARSGKKTGAA